MKICLIAPVPPFRGGIAKYCYSLAQELEKRHDLLLLSYQRQYPELLYGKKSQLDPMCDAARISKEFKQLSYDIDSANILSWSATAEKITVFHPDLLILPWWVTYWAPMYAYLLYSMKKRGIKTVFLCINIFEHENNFLKKSVTTFILRRIDAIIVHSEQEKTTALGINPKAVVVKHLMPLFRYDIPEVERHDPETFEMLFFGFVRPYKGLDTLLKAIALLKNHTVRLTIAGEFWHDKSDYIELIGSLGIQEKVTVIDRYVSDYDMGRHFSRTDLVVLPYKQTQTSGIIATSYGFGKPVLATNVGGFYEIVQDGFTGKLVSPNDPHSLAEGILWYLHNRQINFAENISTFTASTMSWRSLVNALESFRNTR